MEPVMEFKDDAELNKCLDYWKEKLFLRDWIIKAELKDEVTLPTGENCYGTNAFEYSTRQSTILIRKYNPDVDSKCERKYCAEQTLVHELLHCIYAYLAKSGSPSYESAYLEAHEHQQLDRLADTLIMTKYNVSFDFFINK